MSYGTDSPVRTQPSPGLSYVAVLSPLLGGLAWAAINIASISAYQDEPDSDLSVLGLWISMSILGAFGALAVVVPTIGGLCARDDRGRLGAAAAGATFAVLGGVVWLGGVLHDTDFNTGLITGMRVSTIPLFAPAVFVAWMIRSRWRS